MNPDQNTQQNQQLDPSVVALTKAIGQAESGGKYHAPSGDKGSPPSAYQFTPGFIQNYAPKYLKGQNYDPNNLTPAQQDELAYNVVKDWGTNGDSAYPELGKLTPAQIASAWNAGDPNAYLDPEYGKNNNYGSVENYVSQVEKNYQKNIGSSGGSIVPTAEAASSASMDSGSTGQSDVLSLLEGLGAAGLGWLAGHGSDALKVVAPIVGTEIAGPIGGIAAEGLVSGFGGSGQPPTGNTGTTGGTSGGEQPFQLPETPQQVKPQNKNQPIHTELPQLIQSADLVKQNINSTLTRTQSGRNYAQSDPGKDAVNTAALFGLIHPDENGALTFDEDRRSKLEGDLERFEDKLIESEQGGASPMSVSNYAGSFIGKDRFTTPLDKQQAAEHVQKEMEARGIPLNGSMSLIDMRNAQKQHYAAAKGGYGKGKTSAEILAHKALGRAYGQAIRDNVQNKELLDRARKMSQNLTNVKGLGKKLQGKNPPKQGGLIKSLAHAGARYAAVYIGDKIGGPIGAILGDMVGVHLARAVDKKFGKTIFESPSMRKALAILGEGEPKVYSRLLEELKKYGVEVPKESAETKEDLDTPREVKHEVSDLKKATSDQFRNPSKKRGLLPPPQQGKGLKGLIR